MKQFFRENLALAAGIALPVILMVLFFIAGKIPESTVADPQYDMILATNYYHNNLGYPYKIGIENGDLIIRYREPAPEYANYTKPVLYRFDHKTLTTTALDIDFGNVSGDRVESPALDEINEKRLSESRVSPDGWEFTYHYSGNRGLFGDIFGFGGYRSGNVLHKNGRIIPLHEGEYYYGHGEFLAWITGNAP